MNKNLFIGGGDINYHSRCLWLIASDPGTRIHVQPLHIDMGGGMVIICNGNVLIEEQCIMRMQGEVSKMSIASRNHELFMHMLRGHSVIGSGFSARIRQYNSSGNELYYFMYYLFQLLRQDFPVFRNSTY